MSATPANMLSTAISIASVAHEHAYDKGGMPYILHPMRVMMRLRTDDLELMAIAILHDVVEDVHQDNGAKLREAGMSDRIVEGVLSLSRRDGESYDDFIKRCAMNPDGKLVKKEDIRDNSDVTRLKGLRKKDFDRLEKYSKAYMYLSD